MVSAQALASYQVDQADDRSVGFRPAFHSSSSNLGASCPHVAPGTPTARTIAPPKKKACVSMGKHTLIVQSG
jgi:hypothetical protein